MKIKSPAHFRANLRYVLETRGISQRTFAEMASVSAVFINRVLMGRVDPSLPYCDQIAGALGIDLSDMLRPPREFKAGRKREFSKS